MTFNPIIATESARAILGVPGRYFGATVSPKNKPGCFTQQRWKSTGRPIKGYGADAMLSVAIRFDDDCGNGRNTFSITAEVRRPGARDLEAGGCLHDDIARVFPELAPLIKWHLVSTDGPMHYVANTVFLAGDIDHNGLRKGETRQIRNGKTGQLAWIMQGTQTQYHDGDTPPTDTVTASWQPWCRTGEGKERDLAAARNCACWPDAPDSILCADKATLTATLLARLPALLKSFEADVAACGFLYAAPQLETATN
jgi:hypothetical protein